MDTLKQFAENEKKQRIEAEKELHLQVPTCLVYKTNFFLIYLFIYHR